MPHAHSAADVERLRQGIAELKSMLPYFDEVAADGRADAYWSLTGSLARIVKGLGDGAFGLAEQWNPATGKALNKVWSSVWTANDLITKDGIQGAGSWTGAAGKLGGRPDAQALGSMIKGLDKAVSGDLEGAGVDLTKALSGMSNQLAKSLRDGAHEIGTFDGFNPMDPLGRYGDSSLSGELADTFDRWGKLASTAGSVAQGGKELLQANEEISGTIDLLFEIDDRARAQREQLRDRIAHLEQLEREWLSEQSGGDSQLPRGSSPDAPEADRRDDSLLDDGAEASFSGASAADSASQAQAHADKAEQAADAAGASAEQARAAQDEAEQIASRAAEVADTAAQHAEGAGALAQEGAQHAQAAAQHEQEAGQHAQTAGQQEQESSQQAQAASRGEVEAAQHAQASGQADQEATQHAQAAGTHEQEATQHAQAAGQQQGEAEQHKTTAQQHAGATQAAADHAQESERAAKAALAQVSALHEECGRLRKEVERLHDEADAWTTAIAELSERAEDLTTEAGDAARAATDSSGEAKSGAAAAGAAAENAAAAAARASRYAG